MNAEEVVGILLDSGWASRATLARWTGLSKPSVAEVVDQLRGSGLLLERESGSRMKEYSVDSGVVLSAAVSISVEALEVRIVDATGTVYGALRTPHSATASDHRPGHVERHIGEALRAAGLSRSRLRDIVIGVAASFDARTRQLRHAGSLPTWAPEEVAKLVARTGNGVAQTVVENDVKLALLAERRTRGIVDDDLTMCLIWLGPGVGLASWVNGGILQGASGGAGEISYLSGGGSALADEIGADAILELARRRGQPGADGVDAVARAAKAPDDGDLAAHDFLDELAHHVLVAAADICTVIDPGLLVLGGPIGEAGGEQLVSRVASRLPELIPIPCDVEVSVARGDAVLDGATLLATQLSRQRLVGSAGNAPALVVERLGA